MMAHRCLRFCDNAGLADAAATAAGNVKGENANDYIQRGREKALSIQGVQDALIIYKGLEQPAKSHK